MEGLLEAFYASRDTYVSVYLGLLRYVVPVLAVFLLVQLTKLLSPILCFTSQEIWNHLPKTAAMQKYVAFEEIDKAGHYAQSAEFAAKWEQIMAVRDDVKKALEQALTLGKGLHDTIDKFVTGFHLGL